MQVTNLYNSRQCGIGPGPHVNGFSGLPDSLDLDHERVLSSSGSDCKHTGHYKS